MPATPAAAAPVGSSHSQNVVCVMHRTSAEMAASLMPEASARQEACPLEQRKYMIGNELVDWQTHGRRAAPVCAQQAAQVAQVVQGSLAQKATSMVNLRDHRNSDVMREQMQLPVAVEASPENPSPQTAMSRVQSSVTVSPYVRPVDLRVYSFGELSSLPSTMQKDTAYIHSGLKVVKYGVRSPGAFSPNVVRIPAAQVLQC